MPPCQPPLCVEMGFYADISWESRSDIKINDCAHFYKILLVSELLYQPGAWSKLKLPKVDKGYIKLSLFLWFNHPGKTLHQDAVG